MTNVWMDGGAALYYYSNKASISKAKQVPLKTKQS